MNIIVFGLPGSGKSYFACRLAEKIGARYVNSDRLRKELLPERNYSKEEKEIVYEYMLEEMVQAVNKNKNLVLDATFHKKKIRDLFINKMKGKGEIIFMEVQTEEEIIKERVSKKREFSEADFEVYKLIRQQNEPFAEPHLTLKSTNHNIDEMLEKAMAYLNINHDERTSK